MCQITLITGPLSSGKSEFAELLAKRHNNITYVALSELRPNDENWQKKISLHKSRRPKNWKVIETTDLFEILTKEKGILLIDSIGGFVVSSLEESNYSWESNLYNLLKLLREYNNKIIIVGEQVGWGLVSQYEIGNRYADRMGQVLKQISKISKENWLTINGKALKLDNIFSSDSF